MSRSFASRVMTPAVVMALGVALLCGCPRSTSVSDEAPPMPQPSPVEPTAEGPPAAAEWQLSSPAFASGESIPQQHTGDGENVSPPLEWTAPPEGTRELALICDDPDAPAGTFTHWIVYGLAPEVTGLPEGLARSETVAHPALKQGVNGFGKVGYDGPAPPPGKAHRYQFTLYALSAQIDLAPGASRGELLRSMEGKVLGRTMLEGTYGR